MRESPDHSVIDYFQGLGQFWQPNLPTSLPATLERKVLEHPEIGACDRQIQDAVDEEARTKAMTARQNIIKRHRRKALKEHRVEAMEAKQHERLLHGVPLTLDDDHDPLNDLIPEKRRLAQTTLSRRNAALRRQWLAIHPRAARNSCATCEMPSSCWKTTGVCIIALEKSPTRGLADSAMKHWPGECPHHFLKSVL